MGIARTLAWAAAVALVGSTAFAVPLVPTSYDMANGHGTASSGSFNYWDLSYSGAGATSTDNSPLTGGLGDLTDGVIASANWFDVETIAGTGPYVGWRLAVLARPEITFRFSPSSLETYFFDSVTLHFDDSNGVGGVAPPSAIDTAIGADPAINHPVADPAGGAPFSITLPLGGVAGDAVTIALYYGLEWIFLSEVTFDGAILIVDDFDVPAPASLALLAGVLCALGLVRRRSSTAAADPVPAIRRSPLQAAGLPRLTH